MHVDDPRFPPLLTGHGVKAPLRPFEEACRAAAEGRLGAADVVYARHTGRIELALILEPDVARQQAMQMLPLFVLSVIEAVGALMPPQTSVLWRWPLSLMVNGGEAGRFSFAIAQSDHEQVPDWMVLSVAIDLAQPDDVPEPGLAPDRTSLVVEGGGETSRSEYLEVISAFVLTRINRWREGGFAAVHDALIGRIEGYEEGSVTHFVEGGVEGTRMIEATVLGLDEDMRLLVKIAERDVCALSIDDHIRLGQAADTGQARAP